MSWTKNDRARTRPRVSRTLQSHKDRADINNIISRHRGPQPMNPNHVIQRHGAFADVTGYPDYQTYLNIQARAQQAFMTLPATIRRRFNNNAGELVAFLQDETNQDEAIRLGIVPKPDELKEAKSKMKDQTTTLNAPEAPRTDEPEKVKG